MAYMSQDRKAELAPKIKAILKKYKVKGSLSVKNHSTLLLTVKSGPIDFIGNFNETIAELRNRFNGVRENEVVFGALQVNEYHYDKHFTGKACAFLKEVLSAMNKGNHDRSDIMTDYFDVGWYSNVYIGQWNKPYEVKK